MWKHENVQVNHCTKLQQIAIICTHNVILGVHEEVFHLLVLDPKAFMYYFNMFLYISWMNSLEGTNITVKKRLIF